MRDSDLTVKTPYMSSMATKSILKISPLGRESLCRPPVGNLSSNQACLPYFNVLSRLYLFRIPVNFSRLDGKPSLTKGRLCFLFLGVSR